MESKVLTPCTFSRALVRPSALGLTPSTSSGSRCSAPPILPALRCDACAPTLELLSPLRNALLSSHAVNVLDSNVCRGPCQRFHLVWFSVAWHTDSQWLTQLAWCGARRLRVYTGAASRSRRCQCGHRAAPGPVRKGQRPRKTIPLRRPVPDKCRAPGHHTPIQSRRRHRDVSDGGRALPRARSI